MNRDDKPWKHVGDLGLREIVRDAFEKFEDPEHQAKVREEDVRRRAREEENRRRERVPKLVRAGVPKAIAEIIAADKVEGTRAVQAVRQKLDRTVLVLAGNPGCGKTLAACVALEGSRQPMLRRAAEVADLGDSWRANGVLKNLRDATVLVLDDLGVECESERWRSRLDDLFDARISSRLKLIITTNLTAEEFKRRYNPRIWSRLQQYGRYVELDDPDMRVTRLPVRPK